MIADAFRGRPAAYWSRLCLGGGGLVAHEQGLRLLLPPQPAGVYGDAQIDDCQGRLRGQLPWRPPLRLRLRARLCPAIRGTAGFGFWNNPLPPAGGLPALPQALWFLYASPPSAMALAATVPGTGWKAACIDAGNPAALPWAPLAPAVLLLNRWPRFYQTVWPRVQQALRVSEALLPWPAENWHEYELEWQHGSAVWRVDGQTVLATDRPPRGPLGFVAWIDNQWAAADPRGRLGWGLCSTSVPQWLELADLIIA